MADNLSSVYLLINQSTSGGFCTDTLVYQPGINNKNNNKMYIRRFNSEWYQRKSWIFGCRVKNALFCFPCFFFECDVTWTEDGYKLNDPPPKKKQN